MSLVQHFRRRKFVTDICKQLVRFGNESKTSREVCNTRLFHSGFREGRAGSSLWTPSQRPTTQNYHKAWHRSYQYNSWGPRRSGYVRFDSGGRAPRDWIQQKRNQRIVLIVGAGCVYIYVSSRQEIPYTHRHHSVLVDIDTERMLGEQAFRQILAEAKMNRVLLPPHHMASQMVRRVGKRIAAVASDDYGGGYKEQMKGMQWEFAVIQSPDVNAFVVPGGKVVVYTGLLNLIRSEDELAAVLAHEVAHVVARHAAERMTQGSVIEFIRMVAYLGFGIPLFSGPLQALFFLPNSRQAETEADTIGVQLAARACYDASAAATVFEKLGREEKKSGMSSIPAFLRTHPVTEERVRNIKAMVPKTALLAEESGCNDVQSFADYAKRIF